MHSDRKAVLWSLKTIVLDSGACGKSTNQKFQAKYVAKIQLELKKLENTNIK